MLAQQQPRLLTSPTTCVLAPTIPDVALGGLLSGVYIILYFVTGVLVGTFGQKLKD